MSNAQILDGRVVADQLCKQLGSQIKSMNRTTRKPKLHIYRDIDEPSPFTFGLISRAKSLGIDVETMGINHLGMTNEQLIYLSNRDDGVDGIIVIDDGKHGDPIGRIDPTKDVDHYQDDSPFRPAVAMAVSALLDHYECPIEGLNAAVIGRSRRVGLPIALDLLDRGATVTICHSKTDADRMREIVHSSDLVIGATGVENLIHPLSIKKGAWVVDTGCDAARGCEMLAGHITPRNGGLGPLTVACVLANVVNAWADRFMWEVYTNRHF